MALGSIKSFHKNSHSSSFGKNPIITFQHFVIQVDFYTSPWLRIQTMMGTFLQITVHFRERVFQSGL